MCINRNSYFLLLCATVTLLLAFVHPSAGEEKLLDKDPAIGTASEATDHFVIVYYFHGTKRCYTCRRIETLTRQTIDEAFNHEMNTGLLRIKVINVDVEENKHFSKDYQLFTRSVIVSDMVEEKEKRWKNLQRVWELVQDEQAFKEYVRNEIKAYLPPEADRE